MFDAKHIFHIGLAIAGIFIGYRIGGRLLAAAVPAATQ